MHDINYIIMINLNPFNAHLCWLLSEYGRRAQKGINAHQIWLQHEQ